ncbi:MAG: 23S rRNA (pseudouridine(1915)-N(3))-methyltransferase RlmH [Croceitalea sp.]|nr:23S rRNA (pseudouridine(1915)-N(3))-methyltransferase RlmH [Croceitalea sp.]
MNLKLITVGKTDDAILQELIQKYCNRLRHYVNFEFVELADIKKAKNLSEEELKQKEGELILKFVNSMDHVVLLDERGTQFKSVAFADLMQKRMNSGIKIMVFVIGGAYGFSDQVYQRANQKLSLSKMTFSHQMVRLFAVEQIYRAFTILRNEPYHHR